jgi:two-component system chemotaxis sensor kinase CheA
MGDEMDEIRSEFLAETGEMLDLLDQRFVTLETDPANKELLNDIFRSMHSMKGSAGFLGFTHLVEVAHRAENVLNKLRQGDMTATSDVITVILEAVDTVKSIMADIRSSGTDQHVAIEAITHKLDAVLAGAVPAPSPASAAPAKTDPIPGKIGDILVGSGAATREQVIEALDRQEQKRPLGEVLVQMGAVTQSTVDAALHKQAPVQKTEEQTIRVETQRLDSVMNLVGELVLGRNRMLKISSELESLHQNDPGVRELSETLAQLNLVTSDLQLAVMKTRMLPIRKVLSKFPRMVRDLSQKLGKHVRLELQGEETELDKSVADEIGDPLVHLVRNAIDHGVELPADRSAAGKTVEGVIRIAASQEGNSIVIRIEDDGRGLQLEKIKAKALSRGLVSESELSAMDQREIMNLIFLPGFSTAEAVTDVSGRGVGMDVVRTNIRKINGTVELASEPGKGSVVTIKLPLTIAIIQALLVEVGRHTFAIPLSSVIETVRITSGHIKTVRGREVLNLRERVLPLLRLVDAFDLSAPLSSERFYVVVVGVGERQVGIVVDRLRSQEEIVIKSIWDYLTNIKGIAGATITGDGKVVLILDVGEVAQQIRAAA